MDGGGDYFEILHLKFGSILVLVARKYEFLQT